jgi:Ca2+-binding RTX toxin-like protein
MLSGSDRLIGGTGDDIMMGGRGADTFVFNTGDGFDTIGAFAAADIAFDFAGPSVATTGPDFTSGIDTIELSGFTTIDADTVLDAVTDNGDGVAVFSAEGTEITLTGLTASDLNADDFVFV